jgi:hypothetical protein
MASTYKRDSSGRFSSGGGSSAPRGTIAKGGKGISGSVARSTTATGGTAAPAKGMKPRLAVKGGAKQVMKEGINSPKGKARADWIKAQSSERKAKKNLSAAKKLGKTPKAQAAIGQATRALDKAQMKASDAFAKANRKK